MGTANLGTCEKIYIEFFKIKHFKKTFKFLIVVFQDKTFKKTQVW